MTEPTNRRAEGDELWKEVATKLRSGELALSSGPTVEWTEDAKKRFNKALADAFGWKQP